MLFAVDLRGVVLRPSQAMASRPPKSSDPAAELPAELRSLLELIEPAAVRQVEQGSAHEVRHAAHTEADQGAPTDLFRRNTVILQTHGNEGPLPWKYCNFESTLESEEASGDLNGIKSGRNGINPENQNFTPSELASLEIGPDLKPTLGFPGAFQWWAAEFEVRPGSTPTIGSSDLRRHFMEWAHGKGIETAPAMQLWGRALRDLGCVKGRATRKARDGRPILMRRNAATYFRTWLAENPPAPIGAGEGVFPHQKKGSTP